MEPFEAVNARNQPLLKHLAATFCGAAWPQRSQVQDSILDFRLENARLSDLLAETAAMSGPNPSRKVLSNLLAAQ
jgi:hypothetical protein